MRREETRLNETILSAEIAELPVGAQTILAHLDELMGPKLMRNVVLFDGPKQLRSKICTVRTEVRVPTIDNHDGKTLEVVPRFAARSLRILLAGVSVDKPRSAFLNRESM